ncbi:MAG: ribonuclease III [Clostridia bacterium]|nr:ribonuclease III [Clostridia bacterium]
MDNLSLIYEKIGYEFINPALLERALTHSSYANEHGCPDNERLEFLGDTVLSVIVSHKLYELYESTNEGLLSKMRARLVCEQSLELIARKISLGELILLGKGEERTGGRSRASVVSDAFEALIAAIYLDSGIEKVRAWVLSLMNEEIKKVGNDKYFGDFKTQLQEILQSKGKPRAEYLVISETGKEHMKEFVVSAVLMGAEIGRGTGSSKKEAEQKAAKAAVSRLSDEAL